MKFTKCIAALLIIVTVFSNITPTSAQGKLGGGTGMLAFVRGVGNYLHIFVIEVKTMNPKQITSGNSNNIQPAWSPNGQFIAFSSNRGGTYEIYVMNADGTHLRQLTNNRSENYTPAWSPDGSKIAFGSKLDGKFDIYVMSTDGKNPYNLTSMTKGDNLSPSWSLDSNHIAFAANRNGNGEIYSMNADGSNQQNLTGNAAEENNPAWGLAGILFTSTQSGKKQVYLLTITPDGKKKSTPITTEGENFSPAWSPDGKYISYTTRIGKGDYNIGMTSIDGKNQELITSAYNGDGESAWQPQPAN